MSELRYTGGHRLFIEIAKRWIEFGNEVHVVETEYARRLSESMGLKAIAHTYSPSFNPLHYTALHTYYEYFLTIRKALKRIPEERFDFIYCSSGDIPLSIILHAFAKMKLKIPLIVNYNLSRTRPKFFQSIIQIFRGDHPRSPLKWFIRIPILLPKSFLIPYLRDKFLRKSDLIFTISSYDKKFLVDRGIDKERIYVTGSAIDYDYIRSVSSDGKFFDACFLGSITPRKGIYDLVKLWKIIVKEKPNAKLAIIGSGKRERVKKIKELIKEYDLCNNIVMTGFVTEERKYRLLKQSKIFIFPSRGEASAIVIWEAMACGLPVIAYDLPYYREWHGNDIFYAGKGNISGLKRATLTLLEDSSFRKRMGERGRRRAKQRNWDSIATDQLTLVKKVLED